MSTWIKEDYQYTYFQKLCMNILRNAVIPRHVAIIMDGNRRYAAKKSIQKMEGHSIGFEKLSETLQWCRDLNIKEVSVYAFSIHNFNRDSDEVAYLMDLSRKKFQILMKEKHLLEKYEVQVKIIGNLSLLPDDVQDIAREVIKLTQRYNRFYLNICMAYTSHEEITHALNCIRKGVKNGHILEEDIDEDLIDKCMYLNGNPVDLLIRTSGEARLSDFLMWQSRSALVMFVDKYWPDFNVWNLMTAILQFNKSYYFNPKSVREITNDVVNIGTVNEDDKDGKFNHEKASRTTDFLESINSDFTDWLYGRSVDYFN